MSKHTPGPWTVETFEGSDYSAGPQHVIYARAPKPDDDGGYVFAVARLFHDETWDAEANARLIAAAPDMYDALRDILLLEEHAGKVDVRVLMDRVRALVARVEGRDST